MAMQGTVQCCTMMCNWLLSGAIGKSAGAVQTLSTCLASHPHPLATVLDVPVRTRSIHFYRALSSSVAVARSCLAAAARRANPNIDESILVAQTIIRTLLTYFCLGAHTHTHLQMSVREATAALENTALVGEPRMPEDVVPLVGMSGGAVAAGGGIYMGQ